jgi:hypothetical protein
MESLNEINGIVEQNQWIRFRKPSDKLHKTGRITTENRQINRATLARLLCLFKKKHPDIWSP